MTNARSQILSRLGQNTKGQTHRNNADTGATAPQQTPWNSDHFIAQLSASRANVVRGNVAELGNALAAWLLQHEVKSLHIAPQWFTRYESYLTGIACHQAADPAANDKRYVFNKADAALVHATFGIMETGTLGVVPHSEEPRWWSLVPPFSIIQVHERTLFSCFEDAISHHPWGTHLPANLVLISGPSKTADIQQTLAYGAHGPKSLLILLEQEPARPE